MIEILMKTESSQPAEFVRSWGTALHNGSATEMNLARMTRNDLKNPKCRMIASKSFTLGIYPKNLWWQE